jgi:broad specificity phosphatase PhoE
METAIYLVRHGEVYNPEGIWYGRLPGYGLSELGKKQIAQTATYLDSQGIDELYTSELLRAKQSAEIIQQRIGKTPHFAKELLEIDTSFQGHTFVEARAIHDDIFASPQNSFTGETIGQVANRIQHFILEKLREHAGKHIVAVTHGDLLMLARAWIDGLPIVNASIRPTDGSYIRQGEVYKITYHTQHSLEWKSVFVPD